MCTISISYFLSVFFLKFQLLGFIKVLPCLCLLHIFNVIFIHKLIIWNQVHLFMLLNVLKRVCGVFNENKTKSLNGSPDSRVSIKVFCFWDDFICLWTMFKLNLGDKDDDIDYSSNDLRHKEYNKLSFLTLISKIEFVLKLIQQKETLNWHN